MTLMSPAWDSPYDACKAIVTNPKTFVAYYITFRRLRWSKPQEKCTFTAEALLTQL